jgi:hypothetical protein
MDSQCCVDRGSWVNMLHCLVVIFVGGASAGLMVVSVVMNFAFGSSFGRTGMEAYAYGAAFGFADVLKVAAPIVVAKSLSNRKWGAVVVGVLVWGTFTLSSAVSAIGFASAQRTFVVDTRTVQAALNQSRLASLDADQHELRRVRDQLSSVGLGRTERVRLSATSQRLEAAIGTTRGKLEDAAPVVSSPNPQAHTLAQLTGFGTDKIEVGLVLLVALLVEVGGLGPLITMILAKVPKKVPAATAPEPSPTGQLATLGRAASPPAPVSQRPRLIPSAAAAPYLAKDLGRFLNSHARPAEQSALGSSDLLARYNASRRERGLPEATQRRLGDAMGALGHRDRVRLAGGRIHYPGLAWAELDGASRRDASHSSSRHCEHQVKTPLHCKNGADGKRRTVPAVGLVS